MRNSNLTLFLKPYGNHFEIWMVIPIALDLYSNLFRLYSEKSFTSRNTMRNTSHDTVTIIDVINVHFAQIQLKCVGSVATAMIVL